MASDECCVARCLWCGRLRGFVGAPPLRVFCRRSGCELAHTLFELVLEEERSPSPCPEFCGRVWDELEGLTGRIGRGLRVSSGGGQLSIVGVE